MSFWKGFAQGWMQVDDAMRRKELFQEEINAKRNETLLSLYSKRMSETQTTEDYADSLAWVKSRLSTGPVQSDTTAALWENLQKNPELAPDIYKTVLDAEKAAAENGRKLFVAGDQLASMFNIVSAGGEEAQLSFREFGADLLDKYSSGEIPFEDALAGIQGYRDTNVGALDVNMQELYLDADWESAKKMRELMDSRLISYAKQVRNQLEKSDNEQDLGLSSVISDEIKLFESGEGTDLLDRFGAEVISEVSQEEGSEFFKGFEDNPYIKPYLDAVKEIIVDDTKPAPAEAIQALRDNPELLDQFIEKYGEEQVPEDMR